jgi:hypothetical protein
VGGVVLALPSLHAVRPSPLVAETAPPYGEHRTNSYRRNAAAIDLDGLARPVRECRLFEPPFSDAAAATAVS